MSKKSLFPFACAFFLIAKIVWVLVPTMPMGAPRLGDDALVYLWIGTGGSVLQPRVDTPGVRDIISLRQKQDAIDPKLDFLRARTTMRTTGISSSPPAIIGGLFLKAGLSHELAFAASEILVATVLTAGIASILAVLVGRFAAAIGVLLLTFALLPGQGLNFLIPSVFSLALSFLTWAEISRVNARVLPIALTALLAALTHSIALVYICISIAYALLVATARARRLTIPWAQVLALIGAVMAAHVLDYIAGGRLPLTSGMGKVSLSDIPLNFIPAITYLGAMFWSVPLIWLMGAGGLSVAIKQQKIEAPVLLLILSGAFIAGTAFNLEGYPGELSNRLLVPITVILAGLAGLCLQSFIEFAGRIRIAAFILIGAHLSVNANATQLALFENLNSRNYIYDPAAIRAEIQSLPQSASILWTDPDVTMMAAFIEGAWRFHALPYPMIEGSPDIDRILSEWKPGYIGAPVPRPLNTSSEISSRSLSPRHHGVNFADFSSATINFGKAASDSIYLRFSSRPTTRAISFTLLGDGGPCPNPRRKYVAIESQHWIKLDLTRCPSPGSLKIEGAESEISLLGARLEPPSGKVNWPWGSLLSLRGAPRSKVHDDILVRFDWTSLLGTSLVAKLQHSDDMFVLSDISGIVWIKAEFPNK